MKIPHKALLWTILFAVIGTILVILYPDAEQLDSGSHFLFARWAFKHPKYFVGVWERPFFTFLYSFPSQLGYWASKLFTVAISLGAAWQTYRLAQQLNIERATFAIPLVMLQPSMFLTSSAVYTEPLFALIFVIALRLHLAGKIIPGLLVASLLATTRPEGFFIGVLWGIWILFDNRIKGNWLKRPLISMVLATGMFLWWLAALIITHDPLYIKNNWPSNWVPTGKYYGAGPLFAYVEKLPFIVGPLLLVPFIIGLIYLLIRKKHIELTSSFLFLFVVHTILWYKGMFGSAGYARYFVCVAPAIALIILIGWNKCLDYFGNKIFERAATIGVTAISLVLCLLYVDSWGSTRDAWAIDKMHQWFLQNSKPVSRLITSQVYMRIAFNRDPYENPNFRHEKEYNFELIRNSPAKTLIFWDSDTGPSWFKLSPEDFEQAGYVKLKSEDFKMTGLLYSKSGLGIFRPRNQTMSLYYKE